MTEKYKAEVRGEWHDVVDKICNRFELAATLGQSTNWNAEGCAAIAYIMRCMADKLDYEIERQRKARDEDET